MADTIYLKIKPKGKTTGGKKLVVYSTAQRKMCLEYQESSRAGSRWLRRALWGLRVVGGQTLTQRHDSLLEMF